MWLFYRLHFNCSLVLFVAAVVVVVCCMVNIITTLRVCVCAVATQQTQYDFMGIEFLNIFNVSDGFLNV